MATPTAAAPLPKLYIYDCCPFCVRVRAILGLKKVEHELVFVAYHDVDTPVRLVGAKQTPIIQLPSGEAFPESGDIIKYVDENLGGEPILKPASGREDLAAWQKKAFKDLLSLQVPLAVAAPFAEYAQKKSRDYVRAAKEKQFGVPVEELEAKAPEYLSAVNAHLVELADIIHSDRLVDESGLSLDDLVTFATLRGLTLVKDLQWPEKLRSYVEYYSEAADVPLLYGMAQ